MATRKVVKKAASSASKPAVHRVVKDAEIDKPANTDAIESKDASKGGKPKIHAKVIHVLVSIGTEDRNRTHEKMVADIQKKLGLVPYGEKGLHGSVTGGYYILDGKVCLPGDYDPKTGTFKPGAVPPSWAGGPKPSRLLNSQEQMAEDAKKLSSDAYDRKYSLGKYEPKPVDRSKLITPAQQKAKLAEYKASKLREEEAEIEDILDDDEALEAAASASQKRAIKKLTTTKKRVIKKPAAKKRTVTRRK